MAWELGKQKSRCRYDSSINEEILQLEGFLEEDVAKEYLYKFLRGNVSFMVNLLSGVELFPFQHMAVKGMLETDYFLGIWSRGMSKSWTTGIFAFLYCILNPGVKIGIISKSFRQSRMIFRKIQDIAKSREAAYLNQCIGKVTTGNDEWRMEIGESEIYALPLGDGEKLRGYRFQVIIIDEFLLMPEKIYNEVILPFLGVVQNPKERETLYKAETDLIVKGKMKEEDRYEWPANKLVGLSSASFKFEYLYEVYQKYERLIMQELGENDDQEETKGHRVIMQFSYDCAPKQLYDENLIAQSRATMSQSQFDREFGARFTDDSSGFFKTSTMARCTIKDGEGQSVEIIGEKGAKYLLAFDPSWAETESSDDFAIHLFKLNDETKQGTLVHSYAIPGTPLQKHIRYFLYLLQNFNVVSIVGEYAGCVTFISSCNESKMFKDAGLKIKLIEEVPFEKPEEYFKDLKAYKKQYNPSGLQHCYLRKPTSNWIRNANELLQANFDHRRIWFGSSACDEAFHTQKEANIPIKELTFRNTLDSEDDGAGDAAKLIDFLEHQKDMIDYTKAECALIEINTSAQGSATFNLPPELRRQTGPNKARKDSYSALVLGNWMIKIYYDSMNIPTQQNSGFVPFMM